MTTLRRVSVAREPENTGYRRDVSGGIREEVRSLFGPFAGAGVLTRNGEAVLSWPTSDVASS